MALSVADTTDFEWISRLPGLDRLWQQTRGDPSVRIAVLDGAVPTDADGPSAVEQHGVLVRSIIGGAIEGSVRGLAPHCVIVPIAIFDAGEMICTQQRLAAAINHAIEQDVQIINISAAQQGDALALTRELNDALARAQSRDILVVAAAGNHGCACDTLPASAANVLAVGAHDEQGRPLLASNWGLAHRTQGLLAPGAAVPGACVDGGLCRASGTSFASAIVSAIAGLLMSVDVSGRITSGTTIRRVLLASADPPPGDADMNAPFLSGRLNVAAALDRILTERSSQQLGEGTLTAAGLEQTAPYPDAPPIPALAPADEISETAVDGLTPADCGCGCGGEKKSGEACSCGGHGHAKPQLVYAIGRIGISFISQARRDSIWRMVNGAVEGDLKPISNSSLAELFKKAPFQSQSVVWTLSRSEVPMYAIVPGGAFAAETYRWLVEEWSDPAVEFISVPGVMAGQATLYDGSVVDVLVPDLRGMYSWETKSYVKALTDGRKKVAGSTEASVRREMDRFLGKLYFSIRNRGVSPEERALNAAATNAFNFSPVIVEAGQEGLTLRDISVERSPLNRAGSAYYDVLLTFFNPKDRQGIAPLRARFTIDVSDTVPVMIGDPVTWYEY